MIPKDWFTELIDLRSAKRRAAAAHAARERTYMSVTTASQVPGQVPGPVLISPPTEITIPPLPTWTDATSVATFLTALVAILVGGLTLFDPSIVPNVTSLTQALIPSVAGVIAGVVVIANIARHALVHTAAVKAVGAVKVARVTAQSSLI